MGTFRNDKAESRKITISDVADALHVSKTTVSRAISGKGRISEGTRRRVLAYIEENDYKPNVIAKGLAQKKTFNVALVIPEDCNLVDMPFFQNSMQGICEEAAANDYDVMLVMTSWDTFGGLVRMVDNNKVDGVILSRSMVKDKAVRFLKERGVPFVLMGTSRDAGILQVDNDHRAGCRELTGRLLGNGLARVGLIGGNRNYMVNRIRLQGYQDAFRDAKTEPDERLIYEDCESLEYVENAVEELMKAKADCIICMDDAICSMVLQVLARKKTAVPGGMQVASFYDSTLLQNNKPAVTSLLFDDKALGALTCRVLLQYIRGEEVNGRTLLGYEIAGRESAPLKKREVVLSP